MDREYVLGRQGELEQLRATEEPAWRQLSALFNPDGQEFGARDRKVRDDAELIDSTPLYAIEAFVSGLFGQGTNPTQRWFEYGVDDPDLAKWPPVKDWLFNTTSLQHSGLQPAASNFYLDAPAWFTDLGVFGNGFMYQDRRPGAERITERAMPLGQIYIDVDIDGNLIALHRVFRQRGRQIALGQKSGVFQATGNLDERTEYVLIHALYPNPDFRPGAIGPKGKRWISCYVSPDLAELRGEGGYKQMPYHSMFWKRRAGKVWCTGPGHNARADANTLQEIERSDLVAAQFDAEPPVLTKSETDLTAADIVPNAVLEGTMNEQGKPVAQYLERKHNLQRADAKANQKRAAIREALYFSIMSLVNRPQMTATEFSGFREEHLTLLAPALVRIQAGLSAFLARRHSLLDEAQQIAPMPPELMRARVKIEYMTPLAQLQKIASANTVIRKLQMVETVAITDAGARDWIDGDKSVAVLDAAYAGPNIMRDPRAVQQIRQGRAAQQQQAELLAKAGQVADIGATAAHAVQAHTLASQRQPRQ